MGREKHKFGFLDSKYMRNETKKILEDLSIKISSLTTNVDNLSGGRVNWGAGRGFDKTEMSAFDVQHDNSYEKFRENVGIVIEAWRNDHMTHHGKYHQFERC